MSKIQLTITVGYLDDCEDDIDINDALEDLVGTTVEDSEGFELEVFSIDGISFPE